MSQVIAYLASGALFALAIAMLFAGRSVLLVAHLVIGWSAALLALILALAAFAVVGFGYMSNHAPGAPMTGALAIGGALVVVGLVARTMRERAPVIAASACAVDPTPTKTSAVGDAIQALVVLGYGKRDAASAVAAAASSLGSQADVPALVKAALRARMG
jgi:RuvA, C-terminal domain